MERRSRRGKKEPVQEKEEPQHEEGEFSSSALLLASSLALRQSQSGGTTSGANPAQDHALLHAILMNCEQIRKAQSRRDAKDGGDEEPDIVGCIIGVTTFIASMVSLFIVIYIIILKR